MSEPTAAAFVFPGLEWQSPGSAQDCAAVYARHQAVFAPLFALAADAVGAPLEGGVTDGSALAPLPRQAFSFAWGLGMARLYEDRGAQPTVVAGHSLGVYAAVTASGALSVEDGLKALVAAWRCASAEAASGRWGLVAIAGLGAADLDALVAAEPASSALKRVIFNNPVTHVLAGDRDALARVLAEAERAQAKTRWLDDAVPYHHLGLVGGAEAPFRRALEALSFRDAARPVISTLPPAQGDTHAALHSAAALRAFLARNLVSTIAWDGAVRALVAAGVVLVHECGPGQTLSRLGRLVEPELKHVTVRELARAAA